MPAKRAVGPKAPKLSTRVCDTKAETPVFSRAVDMGIMAAMSTMLSQLMVL